MKRIRAIGGRDYPRFYRNDRDPLDLREILSKLPAEYLDASKRLRCDKPIASIEVLADSQYYEEGDWWALTLLSIGHPDGTSTLAFLPIMHTIVQRGVDRKYWISIDRLLADSPELIAYSIGTEHRFRRGANWVAYDAFLDESFAKVLLRLFWPHKTFYSLEASSNGEAEISFKASSDVSDYVMARKASTEIQRSGNIQIDCGELSLVIPKVCGKIPRIEDQGAEEIGRIECSTSSDVITIGILFR